MSPSSIDLEKNIGRSLKPGDIIISREGIPYEVTISLVRQGEGTSRFGNTFDFESIACEQITPYGKVMTRDLFPRTVDVWSDIVPRGNRQGIGLIRRAYYRLKDKPPQVKPSP